MAELGRKVRAGWIVEFPPDGVDGARGRQRQDEQQDAALPAEAVQGTQ